MLPALIVAAASYAQDLSTEVVVDRTVTPKERAATRLAGLTPSINLPKPEPLSLASADYSALAPVVRSYTRLEPSAGAETPEKSPYRGYFSIGYFPLYNLGISAGYRAIDNERMVLNVYGQFNGESYKYLLNDTKLNPKYNIGAIGGDFAMKVNEKSTLSAAAGVYLGSNSAPWRSGQSLGGGSIALGWESKAGNLEYEATANVDIDSYGDYTLKLPTDSLANSLAQQRYQLEGGVALPIDENMHIGLDFEGDFLHSGMAELGEEYYSDVASTLGIIAFTPYYRVGDTTYDIRIGAKVDFTTGGEEAGVSIAPDVHIDWMPMSQLAIAAKFGGGSVLNSQRQMRNISPYLTATSALGRSEVPITADLDICIGPFYGFSATMFGGFAKAESWLMPDAIMPAAPIFAGRDIKGWHAGLRLDYQGSIFNVNASGEIAPSKAEKAYYLWRDRAKYVLKAGADFTGVKNLAVGIGYEYRGHRRAYIGEEALNLGNVNNLSLHANYAFTPRFSVFANLDNILARRYSVVPGLLSARMQGLVGVALRF
jgi:hypothetical protein